MKMKLTQKTIDVIQWVFIIGLASMLFFLNIKYTKLKKHFIENVEYSKQNTYVKIYDSKKINTLKKENKELYDSLKRVKDAEFGMLIHYRERYHTDTIKINEFIEKPDSIYHYEKNNDTVNLNIDVKASNLKWVKTDIALNKKMLIINREKDNQNQTFINHSNTTDIDQTTMWHRVDKTKKWYNRIYISPQIGVGYGLINNKIDCYVGIGVSYHF